MEKRPSVYSKWMSFGFFLYFVLGTVHKVQANLVEGLSRNSKPLKNEIVPLLELHAFMCKGNGCVHLPSAVFHMPSNCFFHSGHWWIAKFIHTFKGGWHFPLLHSITRNSYLNYSVLLIWKVSQSCTFIECHEYCWFHLSLSLFTGGDSSDIDLFKLPKLGLWGIVKSSPKLFCSFTECCCLAN